MATLLFLTHVWSTWWHQRSSTYVTPHVWHSLRGHLNNQVCHSMFLCDVFISHFSLLRTSLNLSHWPNEWRQNSTTSRHHQIQDIVHGAHVIWSRHKCSMFVTMMRCPSIVRWQLNKKHLANLTYSFHYKELKCGIISITILTPYGHIKTAEQQTIIQQYGDKYTGRWWVGCYNWYSPPINSQFISFNVALQLCLQSKALTTHVTGRSTHMKQTHCHYNQQTHCHYNLCF